MGDSLEKIRDGTFLQRGVSSLAKGESTNQVCLVQHRKDLSHSQFLENAVK